MIAQARRTLDEGQQQRAQADADFANDLAARCEKAENLHAEQLAAAQSAMEKLISDGEKRAATAEQRAVSARAHAVQVVTTTDQRAHRTVEDATNARGIVTRARTEANRQLAEAGTDAERLRTATQRHTEELSLQNEKITRQLARLRHLLDDPLPCTDIALESTAPRLAITTAAHPSSR